EPDRQVVREGEGPPRVGRAARVVEDELGRAAHAAAVGEELLPGGEHAELDELDGVVALPAAQHLVDRDQMIHCARGARHERDQDRDQRCRTDAQGCLRTLSGYVPVKFSPRAALWMISCRPSETMSPSPCSVKTKRSGSTRLAPVATEGARPWSACRTSMSMIPGKAV